MVWTHIYDLLFKVVSMFLAIILLIQIPFFENNGMLLVLTATVGFVIMYVFIFRTFTSFLYARINLGMKINFTQASKFNQAFSPLYPFPLQWLPMIELKQIEPALRYEKAMEFVSHWQAERTQLKKSQMDEFSQSEMKTKIIRVIFYLLVVYFIIASFMNWPPSNYITDAFGSLFNTDSYYPVINAFVLIIPTFLIMRLFDKNLK